MTECSLCNDEAVLFLRLHPQFAKRMREIGFMEGEALINALDRPGSKAKAVVHTPYLAMCSRHKDRVDTSEGVAMKHISESEYLAALVIDS